MNVRFPTDALHQVACDVLAVGVGPTFDGPIGSIDERFDGKLIAELKARKFKGNEGQVFSMPTLGRLGARTLLVVGVGDRSWTALRAAAGRLGREARSLQAHTVGLALGALEPDLALRVVEAAVAGNYLWQTYKPEDDRSPAVDSWLLLGLSEDGVEQARRSDIKVRWQSWGRDLVNAPAADLYPESLAAKARELEKIPGVTVEVWDIAKCKAENCAGIVAVGQGSDRPGCLIHVRYRPENAKDHVALIGKGVTFDSGGYSLKPSDGMQTMRCDMGGAAMMLAATGAAAELGLPVAIDCLVPAVENLINGNAYKLGDVLRYSNGVTVEIHNTDAEGRLVLADALIRACQVPGVKAVVDSATLTGACVVALGDDFSALYSDDEALAGQLEAAAKHAGELVWRMPLHGPYKDLLKSDHAQLKNVGGRAAGSITAALFLQYFVPKGLPWAHLDIAGPAFMDKATSRYAAGGTGELVRSVVRFLEQRSA